MATHLKPVFGSDVGVTEVAQLLPETTYIFFVCHI